MRKHDLKKFVFIRAVILFVGGGFVFVLNKDRFLNYQNKKTYGGVELYNPEIKETQEGYTEKIIKNLQESSILTKKDIIISYCDAVLEKINGGDGFSSESIGYYPKGSLFLYHLCTYVELDDDGKYKKIFEKTLKDFIKSKRSFEYVNSESKQGNNMCDVKNNPTLKGCLLVAKYGNYAFNSGKYTVHDLFEEIMNAYFNFALASSFGSSGNPDSDIKAFSNKFFGDGNKICGGSDVYLNMTNVEKSPWCSHPNTAATLKKFFKNYDKYYTNDLIKTDTFFGQTSCGEKNSFSLAFCNNIGSTKNTKKENNFLNLVLNELLWYKLFVVYYNYSLSKIPQLCGMSSNFSDNNVLALGQECKQEIFLGNSEMEKSIKAVEMSFKYVNQIKYWFPVHIGFLAYYEDVINIRKSFKKIYTPIHQLYYKLRNVQTKD